MAVVLWLAAAGGLVRMTWERFQAILLSVMVGSHRSVVPNELF